MSRTACNNRGISLVEVLITLFLTTVGILALLSMQPTAWKTAGRSDFMGRAAGILQSELERGEVWLMNPNNTKSFSSSCDATKLTLGTCSKTINASSQSATQTGDVPFYVTTLVQAYSGASNAWTLNVKVTWPGNTRGIEETMIVSNQEYFTQ